MFRRLMTGLFVLGLNAFLPVDFANAATAFHISATQLDDKTVQIDVQTDYAGEIEFMASVGLVGQADTDVWIGGSEHLKVINGRGSALVKPSQVPAYPEGTYTAEIYWNPKWLEIKPEKGGQGLTDLIEVKKTIRLRNKELSANDAQRAQNATKWVMDNLYTGSPWEGQKFESLLGKPVEIPISGRWNSAVTQAFYYPTADVTIFKNNVKNTVAVWRLGKKSE